MLDEGRLQRRALVVDDDAAIRRVLAEALAEEFHIRDAADGVDALDLVERETFDVILLDLPDATFRWPFVPRGAPRMGRHHAP